MAFKKLSTRLNWVYQDCFSQPLWVWASDDKMMRGFNCSKVFNKNLIWANYKMDFLPSPAMSVTLSKKEKKKSQYLTPFHLDVVICDIDGHLMTYQDSTHVSLDIETDSGSVLSCPRNSRINRNISARIPGGWWLEGSWSDDNAAKENSDKDMRLPRALIFLDILSILFVVSSYLLSQLGRILSGFAPPD